MVKRNPNIAKLKASYLFPEINMRRQQFLAKHPDAKLISLGIGNTTEPITPSITLALERSAKRQGTLEGYTGYGPEQGLLELRQRIANGYYNDRISADEMFISDGSKCDIGRLQQLFGSEVTIAVQDPSYPVYVDGSVITGLTGSYDSERGHYPGIVYMPCTPENQFFPDLSQLPRTDLIYFCSPNNPTGAVATHQQLEALVAFARKNRSIIIYDAAYASYIRDAALPRSIFEIEGAEECALETNSFSKLAGFTGVRLGWTVVPEKLKFEDGSSVRADWNRITTTIFNGASNIVQVGALAVLQEPGLSEVRGLVDFYLANAQILKKALEKAKISVYGGVNAPYLWAHFPGRKSWEVFQEILETKHLVTTPGLGYGPSGEGFIRFSAFGHRAAILEAAERLIK
jgi:LL-diaminopimelate aminotransferase